MKSQSPLPYARLFWELVVYQRARALQGRTFALTQTFPPKEKHSLTDQARRASRSIGAQIAEAWAKCDYSRHFISKLSDALAETFETQHWLITAVDSGYVDRIVAAELFGLCSEVARMLTSMSDRASEFCPDLATSVVQETSPLWYCDAADPFLSPGPHPGLDSALSTAH